MGIVELFSTIKYIIVSIHSVYHPQVLVLTGLFNNVKLLAIEYDEVAIKNGYQHP